MTELIQKKNCHKKMCQMKVYNNKGFRTKTRKIIEELGGPFNAGNSHDFNEFVRCKPVDDSYLNENECLKLNTPKKSTYKSKSPPYYRERSSSSRYNKKTPPRYFPITKEEKLKKYNEEQDDLGNYARSYRDRAPFDGLGGRRRRKTSRRYKKKCISRKVKSKH